MLHAKLNNRHNFLADLSVIAWYVFGRAPGISLQNFHTNTRREKERALQKVARRGGVVLTSYGMLVRPENTQMLSQVLGRELRWVRIDFALPLLFFVMRHKGMFYYI